uniref:GG16739 n=1 Tax=Drosophila erecta TaxID=7220 RepID=B3P8P8_DROER
MEMEITACGSKWQMCVTVTATPRGFLPVAVAAGNVAASVAPTAAVTANQVPNGPNGLRRFGSALSTENWQDLHICTTSFLTV